MNGRRLDPVAGPLDAFAQGRVGLRLRFAADISARVYQDWVAVVAVGAELLVMCQVKAERHGAAVTMHGRTFQLDAETFPSPLPSATSNEQST
jgi:hypothetical protein